MKRCLWFMVKCEGIDIVELWVGVINVWLSFGRLDIFLCVDYVCIVGLWGDLVLFLFCVFLY